MRIKKITLIALLFCSQIGNAQTADRKLAIGLNFVRNEYNGDYGNGILAFGKKNYFAGGLTLSAYMSPSFDFGVQSTLGNYGYWYDVENMFKGVKFDASLFTHYKFNNGHILPENSKFSPFISAGLGIAAYATNDDANSSPTIITNGFDLVVPVGVGVKYQLSKLVAFQYQYLYSITSRDNHDQNRGANVVLPHEKKGNDAYGQHLLGVVLTFGAPKEKDSDKDGVADKYDICNDTPQGVKVDSKGCPLDSDNDGVADYLDKSPNTPVGVKVDKAGCPVDTDKDGVADYLDSCPDTPIGVKVDKNGCPTDADADGVADYLDKCPDTPTGVKVDAAGCPVDTDKDSVPDYLDTCPNTPAGVKVDKTGCPIDTDGDGIPDYLDKCPVTAGPEKFHGCPDTDGDGIPDNEDNCPTVAGTLINKGCPEKVVEETRVVSDTIQVVERMPEVPGIKFKPGRETIDAAAIPVLTKIVELMKSDSWYTLEVSGFAKVNNRSDAKNIVLAQNCASVVKAYLVNHGISATRIIAKGFVDTPGKPRRVEFKFNMGY